MNFSDLTFRLMLIFFPGILCHLMVDSLTVHKERQPFHVVVYSFVYGVVCYLIYGVLSFLCFGITIAYRAVTATETGALTVTPPPPLNFTKILTDPKASMDYVEIFLVAVIACTFSLILGFLHKRKTWYWLADKLSATPRFAELNVWSHALNSREAKWAVLRDLDNDFMYQGYIQAFSDLDENAEILLTHVAVFQESTGNFLYEADRMYLSRKRDSITLELLDYNGGVK